MKKQKNTVKEDSRSKGHGKDVLEDYYSLVLDIVEEVQPLLSREVNQRKILAVASMSLGQILRTRPSVSRHDLRREVGKYLVDQFPLSEEEKPGDATVGNGSSSPEDLSGSRILIVDDSAMARRQIRFFTRKAGYQVFEAKSGEEALWLVNETEPDLILMDVSMEGIDGIEACRRLKTDPQNENLPVIFLSAKGEREEIMRGFQSGAIDYIVKPFHPSESLTRMRTHLRVRKLAQLREESIRELEQLNATKDRILRVASHDLRNPTAAIAGLAKYLREDGTNLTENQRELISCIEEAGNGVVVLLNELLDLASLDSGQLKMEPEPIALGQLVQNLLPLFKGEAEGKDIKVSFQQAEEVPETVGDRMKLRRVVDNLLSNAIKFTPPGGQVAIRIYREGDHACLDFEDNGPGIAEEEQHLLFKEFGKTSNEPTGGEKSTGLGLSICKRIVCSHNGDIEFENLPGSGARFRVKLPVSSS
ncbi:MAG: response regulator [Verrucomicrobia bacterium]|jgi:signal transduction histidine kinase|nr:response regulator [Verrucomicrobiota bacterium]